MKQKVLFLFLLLFGCLLTIDASQDEIALVLKSKGLASVSYGKCTKNQIISKGYLIIPGAQIQTGSNGFVNIKFVSSNSKVIIRPRSEVNINCTYDSEQDFITETVEIKAGEVYFAINQPANHAFDVYTPTNLASLKSVKCLILLAKNNYQATFYNLEGNMEIADNNFTTWWQLSSKTAAFSAGDGFVNISPLSEKSLPRLFEICDSTQKLKTGPILVHTLTLKSPNEGITQPNGKLTVLDNVGIDIKAVPEGEFDFTRWNIVDGNVSLKDITSSHTQIFVHSDAIVEAQFSEKPSFLKIIESKYGKTDPSGTISIQKGLPINVRIVPKKGYTFNGWKVNGKVKIKRINPSMSEVILFSKQGEIRPKYRKKSYALSVKTDKNCTLNLKKTIKVAHGDSLELSATPKKPFRFIQWKIKNGYVKIREPRNKNTIIVCDSMDTEIQTVCAQNSIEVSIMEHEQAKISPQGIFYVPRNSFLTVNVKPDTGLEVTGWQVERGKAHVQGFENATIKCKTPFEIIPNISIKKYNLTLLTNNLGTVIPSKVQRVTHNVPYTIIAKPNKGKYFINWKLSGGWAEIADAQKDTTSVLLHNGNAILQACFAPTICTLTISSTQGGYTEPTGIVKNYVGGKILAKAVPNPRAAFLGWRTLDKIDSTKSSSAEEITTFSDSVVENENILFSDTVTVPEQTITSIKGNASIEAIFSTETVKMAVQTNGLGTTSPEDEVYVVQDKWTRITATPNTNQMFLQWSIISGEEVKIEDPFKPKTNINPGKKDVVIKALFQPDSLGLDDSSTHDRKYTLLISCDLNKGIIDKANKIILSAGSSVTITATPKNVYYFEKWNILNGSVYFSDENSSTTTVTLKRKDAIIAPLFRNKSPYLLEITFRDSQGRLKTIKTNYQ